MSGHKCPGQILTILAGMVSETNNPQHYKLPINWLNNGYDKTKTLISISSICHSQTEPQLKKCPQGLAKSQQADHFDPVN